MQVDDNMVNRRVATSMLARYGANVVAVNGGAEALKALSDQDSEEAYDLVLMDIQMPEVGFMILRCHLQSCLRIVENVVVGLVGPFVYTMARGLWPWNFGALETHSKAVPWKIEIKMGVVTCLHVYCKDIKTYATRLSTESYFITILFMWAPAT